MGQAESKSELKEHYPFYPTDFEIKRIINRTDLNRNEVQLLWNYVWLKAVKENGKVNFENFVGHFCQNAWGTKRHEEFSIKNAFLLLDTNGDGWLEFMDFAIYIFSFRGKMMRRSFQFYDKEKQRSIGKKEIFSVMLALKMFDDKTESRELAQPLNENIYPQEVEDMFNLIEEFDHNNDISESEFLSATNKYQKLENFLKISILEETRFLIVEEIKLFHHNLIKEGDQESNFSQSYISLTEDKSANSSDNLNMFSACQTVSYFDWIWICRRNKPSVESNRIEKSNKLDYGATQNRKDQKNDCDKVCEDAIKTDNSKSEKDGFNQVFGLCNSNFRK